MSHRHKPRRPRESPSIHVVPGERAVRELLSAAPGRIEVIRVDRRRDWTELQGEAEAAGVVVEPVEADLLRRDVEGADPRGVVAYARPPTFVPLDEVLLRMNSVQGPSRQILVALDGVADPQNLGAIMRSCEFFGVHGLLWTRDRAAQVTPAVVRASAGASERVPLVQVTNLVTALGECKEAGLWIVGTVAEEGTPLATLASGDTLPERLVIVMGSEGRGIRRLTREHCDFLGTIERRGHVGSLNVSVATAVMLSWLVGSGTPAALVD